MKVKAKTNIKYGNGWYAFGEVFEMKDADVSAFGSLVEAAGEPAARPAPKTEEKLPEAEPAGAEEKAEAEEPAKPKPARRKKAAE